MHTDLDGADLDVDVRARAGKKFEAETEPKRRAVDYDGRLSRAGGHGGAVGEERVVDVCVSVIYVKMPDLFWRGLREGSWVGMVQRLAAVIRH